MSLQTLIGDSRPPAEGFFGNISAAFQTGISKIGSDILPNWVQSQVSRQANDQMSDNTFDSTTAPLRIAGQSIQDAETMPPAGMFQKAFLDIQTGNIGNMPVLILAGLLLIGVIIVIKKV